MKKKYVLIIQDWNYELMEVLCENCKETFLGEDVEVIKIPTSFINLKGKMLYFNKETFDINKLLNELKAEIEKESKEKNKWYE